MWGIQVGRIDIAPVVKSFLNGEEEEDDITAETDALTTLAGDWSDSESDDDDAPNDFAIENRPQPPQAELVYGGQGTCEAPARVIVVPDACPVIPAKKQKKRGIRGFTL